jgi:small subunit ribosomal protein S20
MANLQASKKAIRVIKRKTAFNSRTKNTVRDAKKAVLKAIANKDAKEAQKLMPAAQKALDKAAKRKVIEKNTAARIKSRLVAKIKAII